MDEVFGSENFVRQIRSSKTAEPTGATTVLAASTDYFVWYASDAGQRQVSAALFAKDDRRISSRQYTCVEHADGDVDG